MDEPIGGIDRIPTDWWRPVAETGGYMLKESPELDLLRAKLEELEAYWHRALIEASPRSA